MPGSRIGSPQYRWYVAAQCVSLVGSSMSSAALYWLAIQVAHGNGLLLSVVVAAQFIPFLVFSRRAGSIVAKRRPARLLIVTQTLQLVASLAFAVPLFAGWMSPWYLCPLALLLGFVQTVDVPARQMLMLDLVGPEELRRGTSLYNTFIGLAKILGPSLAGAIIAATGEGLVFAIDSTSFIFVVYVLMRFSSDIVHVTGSGPASRVTTRRFRWVLDLPGRIQAIAFMALLLGGFAYQFEVTSPLMATKVFHLGAVGYGLMGTFIAAGGIAGSYYSSRRPDPGMYEILVWSGLFGAAEAVAAVMGSAWEYDLLMLVIGFATQLFATSSNVYIQQNAPERLRAHSLAAYNSGFMGFVPAGAFVVAAIAASVGVRWSLIGPGLVLLAFAILAAARLSLAPSSSAPLASSAATASRERGLRERDLAEEFVDAAQVAQARLGAAAHPAADGLDRDAELLRGGLDRHAFAVQHTGHPVGERRRRLVPVGGRRGASLPGPGRLAVLQQRRQRVQAGGAAVLGARAEHVHLDVVGEDPEGDADRPGRAGRLEQRLGHGLADLAGVLLRQRRLGQAAAHEVTYVRDGRRPGREGL